VKKKHFKFVALVVLALYVGLAFGVRTPESLKQEGLPTWWDDVRSLGNGRFLLPAGANVADAQIVPTPQGAPTGPANNGGIVGGPVGGVGQVSLPGQVSGQLAITGQSTLLQVPAAGYSPRVYSKCGVSIASPLPPAANDLVGCVVTSTATVTVIAAATVTQTVGAINIQAAGTPTAAINWWLIK